MKKKKMGRPKTLKKSDVKFVLRISKKLDKSLKKIAKQDRLSKNSEIIVLLEIMVKQIERYY